MSATPQAMKQAEIQRQRFTRSLRTRAAMTVAKRMLDSRNAATSAIGAWVKAHTAIQ